MMSGYDDFASAYALAVAAARAVPADERGLDITSLLDVDTALNLAAASLPMLHPDGSLCLLQSTLASRQVALLRYLVCLDVGIASPLHPELGSAKLLPALAPLVKVDVATGCMEPQPLLQQLLAAGASAAAATSVAKDAGSGSNSCGGQAPGIGVIALPHELKSVELFAKLLVLADLNKQMRAPCNSLQLLDLAGRVLDDSAACAGIAMQLEALQKLCAFSSGSGGAPEVQLQGWRAPTSAQLRAVFHVLNWQASGGRGTSAKALAAAAMPHPSPVLGMRATKRAPGMSSCVCAGGDRCAG